jgi:hypothetical protein
MRLEPAENSELELLRKNIVRAGVNGAWHFPDVYVLRILNRLFRAEDNEMMRVTRCRVKPRREVDQNKTLFLARDFAGLNLNCPIRRQGGGQRRRQQLRGLCAMRMLKDPSNWLHRVSSE